MKPFQSLSFSGGGGISMQGQVLHRHNAHKLARRQRAFVFQAEGHRFSDLCSSINPTF
jgi:ABC-type cobalamin transport system ATPase subunit